MIFSKTTFFSILICFAMLKSFAQNLMLSETNKQKFTVSGTISDSKNNETLIGVTVSIPELKTSIVTNEYGFYSITIPKGKYTLIVSYVGFQTREEPINLDKNIKSNFKITSNEQVLQEVLITGRKNKINTRSSEMSVNKLSIATIKKMPVIFGEVDIIKSILLLPGVTNAGEGASGFNVRGGGADQNLILLDEATIFNSSHLFGFFSVFNPDAIKDLKLYKGGIPARFGGRASSVLEIYQKDGNSNKLSINGGIGVIASRLLAEGPIVKDKGSFLVAGRATYAHLFLKLSEDQKDNVAYFYDFNAKVNYKFNENNNVHLSGYFGRDVVGISNSFTNTYGNSVFNLRWNHLFSDKLFSNLSLIYSDYYYGLSINNFGFQWDSNIQNYNFKYDFKNYVSDKIKLNFGASAIYYNFNPGTLNPSKPDSGINFLQLDKKNAFEPAVYIGVEQKIAKDLEIAYGLRSSMFYRLGASEIDIYKDDLPVAYNSNLKIYSEGTSIGKKSYSRNQSIKMFNNLEPRFSASYSLSDDKSVKISYNRMVQYLQLISNTSSPTPLDIWTPSDTFIQPQIADQVAAGYFVNFNDDKYSFEVESFYKKIQNRLDYIDGANLIANNNIERIILNGRMRSYGLEMLLRKNKGDFSGWISYTLSKSEQQTPGRTANEVGINNGNWYSSAYDKLHNLAITASYKLNEKWSFGSNFILQTGQPATFPNGQYTFSGLNVPSFSQRNANRLPAYHHLDISATLTSRKNKDRKWQSEWVFSIYNVYNRMNAASINFRQNQESGVNEAVRTSIFGVVPGVSYNFKF
jgi:CarboxypepD_reg-like domain/TonB dependent receptor/TonB-dependent Receptor Plug Domain